MTDFALDDSVFIESNVAAALQELDILFNTENTELIGYPTYGVNFEQFLWQLSPSPNALKSYIEEHIEKYTFFCRDFDVVVNVNILEGEYRNIYNVMIMLRIDPKSRQAAGFRIYQLR